VFLANLGLGEFLALLAAGSALTVALYLLSRARKKIVVSTLRFWQAAKPSAQTLRRRRLDQPWSLALQLLGLALLLLAIAQPRWGSREQSGRDHILLLDTSSWMAARTANGTLLQEAQRAGLRWLRTLPSQDRVMLVRAEALSASVTRFESNRSVVEEAIRASKPSSGALNLTAALDFAANALRVQAGRPGEIVYAGASRVSSTAAPEASNVPANLRVLPVATSVENCGLTRVRLRRSPADPLLWEIFVVARNYGTKPRTVPLAVGFGGAPVATRSLMLAPGAEVSADLSFRTKAAGWLEVRLFSNDALPADDRVTLELPEFKRLRVAVFSDSGELLRPLLSADPRVEAVYAPPSAYVPAPDADLMILDRMSPPAPPQRSALWIEPPAKSSPIPVKTTVAKTSIARWRADSVIAAGLRSKDVKLDNALIFRADESDTVVVEAAEGPLLVTRPSPRLAVIGFNPMRTALKYELVAPLLFANLIDWLAPEILRRRELEASSAGTITVALPPGADPSRVKITAGNGGAVPFTVEGRELRFFAGSNGTMRLQMEGAEQLYSISLPQVADAAWDAPPDVARGFPANARITGPKDLWKWFAGLGAAVLAFEWWWFVLRKRAPRGRLVTALKLAALAAVVLAFFNPQLPIEESKLAVGVLVDTSASVGAEDLERADQLLAGIEKARGRNQVRVLPFARSLRGLDATEFAGGWKLRNSSGETARATDLEAAVLQATSALPEGLVPRIVLISDGKENRGSLLRAAYHSKQLGIPIDTFALEGRPQPRLRLNSVRFPPTAFTGERFPVELSIESPSSAHGRLKLTAEGKTLGESDVQLKPGDNLLRLTTSVATPGAIDFATQLQAGELGEVRTEQAVTVRRPRVLYLSSDVAGMETHFLSALAAGQFEVTASKDLASARFDEYQVVVLNNWDLEGISAACMSDIEQYVRQGGGLLVIGGEKNMYVDKKGKPEDPLDRALPAVIAPPRSPEGTCVVLIIDKSSSMEGRKMELARMAAIGVVENLRPIDQVGILIFDNSHQWAVPIRRAEDRTMIKRLIAGIMPDGGTQIAPALAEAYKKIKGAQGAYKHVVLLTDGISEEGDSMTVAKDAATDKITISTVGLGQDVNRAYLEKVAANANGKSYFLTDPSGLEQILLKDVKEHTGSTLVEKPLQPIVLKKVDLLEGVNMEKAPPLKGYVRFQAKPTAETILRLDRDDPLLSRWQYGLGRSAVFTSDAKSRWAEAWVGWPGYDRFWTNLMRDLLPHAQPGEANVSYDEANGDLLVEYRLARHVPEPSKVPQIFVFGPDGFRKTIDVRRTAEGVYQGRAAAGERQGLFRVRPLEESRAFPEAGFYRPEVELTEFGSNESLLRQVAAYTGGTYQPRPDQIFTTGGRTIPSSLRLWPGLLALALLLNFAELAWRKLRSWSRISPRYPAVQASAA
jgi:Ca-activated chloride channel family protein